jgi:phosphoenolpyruvate-protein phosphotransferase/dihydroxyacetone kinase phosphotransfer subunit
MVGIVIVSHSAKLAEGVRDIASQMVQGQVPIAVAGGTADLANPLGTDASQVQRAIESVYSDDGVLVLMDLGSALLSAELALEFLRPEQQPNIYLCEAPLVEGALAAAVQAMAGSPIEQVMAEARGALAAKASQLQPREPAATPSAVPTIESAATTPAETLTLTIPNRLGLHARPAARFVTTVNQYRADVTVQKGAAGLAVNARSINQVATLGLRQGDQMTLIARGPDAGQLLAAIQGLASNHFGDPPEAEDTTAAAATKAATSGELAGTAASPGIAIGPAVRYQPALPAVTRVHAADPAAEWNRLQTAMAATYLSLRNLELQATRQLGAAEAAIFEAHRLFLEDPTLREAVRRRIFSEQINAEAAWEQEVEAIAGRYRALEDDYMRARSADILDVGQRVLGQLMAWQPPPLQLDAPSILIAPDLTPSDMMRLDTRQVLAIATESGSARGHAAILARAAGIPAVVGLGNQLWHVAEGQTVALDGRTGCFWPRPTKKQLASLQKQQNAWQAAQKQLKIASQKQVVTTDGRRIEVAANIGRSADAGRALEFGAEGVGLFRTEFLFLDRDSAPDEAEQLAAYRAAAQVMGQKPLIIRTLDVGGDKPLPYLGLQREDNPFLGWRGIRFCLERPDIFTPQLRAILQASAGHNVKLMFPMVSALDELRAAKEIVARLQQELRRDAIPFDETMPIGIMIEVPAAVAIADRLAAEVDFFSIGTNDLTQYTMAADRTNDRVTALADPLQPAVLRLIHQTVTAAHNANIWVGLCGELAGDPLAAPLLVGLGLDELSMNAAAIPAVKQAISHISAAALAATVPAILALDSAAAVRHHLQKHYPTT